MLNLRHQFDQQLIQPFVGTTNIKFGHKLSFSLQNHHLNSLIQHILIPTAIKFS